MPRRHWRGRLVLGRLRPWPGAASQLVSAECRQPDRNGEDEQDERPATPTARTPSLDALQHRDLHQAGESTPLIGCFGSGPAASHPPVSAYSEKLHGWNAWSCRKCTESGGNRSRLALVKLRDLPSVDELLKDDR